MTRKLCVDLPVKNLSKSVDFFTQLGFEFDPNLTDETATCMIVNGEAFVMLLTEARFRDFSKKDICDATTHTEAILAFSVDSNAQVDELVNEALAAGGQLANDPISYDFMYVWSFQDIDGHLWEVFHMDPGARGQ